MSSAGSATTTENTPSNYEAAGGEAEPGEPAEDSRAALLGRRNGAGMLRRWDQAGMG